MEARATRCLRIDAEGKAVGSFDDALLLHFSFALWKLEEMYRNEELVTLLGWQRQASAAKDREDDCGKGLHG